MAKGKFQKVDPFNPLDKKSLGESVAGAMLSQCVGVLPPTRVFMGAGVYAIYYTGNFPCYEKFAERNRDGDFCCRFLVVDDIWIPLAESLLIEMFMPLWNLRIDGFGNHDPGRGRHKQKRSPWDTLHPGRPWASRLAPPAVDEESLQESIGEYIARPDD